MEMVIKINCILRRSRLDSGPHTCGCVYVYFRFCQLRGKAIARPNENERKPRQMLKKSRELSLKILRRFPLNVRAVSAKIKLPKKYLQHCHILRTDKKNLSLLLLPSWPRERKLDLKLSIFQLKRRFMSVQNKMAPVFSILLRDLKLIFLRMLENFIAGSLGQVN